mmetsp:Transcript_5363/g.12186  ORF Transcript_5363/g.12186 Transcript_5363/m.12186 type:complete len:333 (-) Transcript_5363:144-1142(-)
MNKLLSFAAISAVAAAADEGLPSISSNRQLDGITTADLEAATWQFVEAHVGRKRPKNTPGSGGGATGKRSLRSTSTRKNRKGGKGGKDWGGSSQGDDGYDNWRSSSNDWHSGKSGKSGGGWGSGKSGEWSGDGGWKGDFPHEEMFYMLPTACPNECISSYVSNSGEMVDSLKTCKIHEESQQWLVRSDESYIMIESYDQPGMCIAVDFERGDDELMVAETCYNGELVLKDCHADYGTEWYFTGGQLLNSFCWASGLSSMMTIFIEDKGNKLIKECVKDLAVWGAAEEAVLKADTFMFVNRLPDAPFFIDVDDVLDGKEPKIANMLIDTEGKT